MRRSVVVIYLVGRCKCLKHLPCLKAHENQLDLLLLLVDLHLLRNTLLNFRILLRVHIFFISLLSSSSSSSSHSWSDDCRCDVIRYDQSHRRLLRPVQVPFGRATPVRMRQTLRPTDGSMVPLPPGTGPRLHALPTPEVNRSAQARSRLLRGRKT